MLSPQPATNAEAKLTLTRAVLLLAGCGRRLLPLTASLPKCLLEVQGRTILERALGALVKLGLEEVVLVVGHEAEQVKNWCQEREWPLTLTFVEVPDYENHNNLFSLWEARDLLKGDLLLIEGDLLFEPRLVERMLRARGNAMALAPCRSWHAGTVVRLEQGQVVEMLLRPEFLEWCRPETFKTVNVYRLEAGFLEDHFLPRLESKFEAGHRQEFYEVVLAELLEQGRFEPVPVDDLRWCEVDDPRDLEMASRLFAPPQERYQSVRELHGGYWRQLIVDHSYLYNPYFPPQEMFAEFHRDLRALVSDYPVGQREMAKLLSLWLGVQPDCLAVANGASELIRILGQQVENWTVPVPSFNEFEVAVPAERLTRFALSAPDWDLDVEALARAASTEWVVVVSPNNPTSRAVPHDQLRSLAGLLQQQGRRLLVDESFVEFSNQRSLVEVLDRHPNLVILKSLSKVFGIAGLRLGYLLSSDLELIRSVRRATPIWNINGFAEAFLRSLPRYRREFEESCRRVRSDRDLLYQELLEIPGLAPLAPQANFIFCRTQAPAAELAERLFVHENVLVKDCSNKTLPGAEHYLRIASRTQAENTRLAGVLRRTLKGD